MLFLYFIAVRISSLQSSLTTIADEDEGHDRQGNGGIEQLHLVDQDARKDPTMKLKAKRMKS
jgi:hypothetical protein